MAEYIERETLMKFPIRREHCDKEHANEHFINGIETVMEYAENLPAADVEPVRHEITDYECSICGRTCAVTDGNGEYILPDVCPGCWAKMDGDRDA